MAVLPARARRPKDKAKVKNGVLVVTRWVLARLRHQRFFSLNELNRVLRTLLADLNQRPFKKLPGCRASAFAEMDRPALRALPERRYEYACAFKGRHTTLAAHMPAAHREVAGWSADTLTARAAAVGPRCAVLVERLLGQRRHPQQAFHSCLGVLSLGQKYGVARLEAACVRALKHSAVSYKSVQAILKNGLDLPEHENLRGAAYYQSNQLMRAINGINDL